MHCRCCAFTDPCHQTCSSFFSSALHFAFTFTAESIRTCVLFLLLSSDTLILLLLCSPAEATHSFFGCHAEIVQSILLSFAPCFALALSSTFRLLCPMHLAQSLHQRVHCSHWCTCFLLYNPSCSGSSPKCALLTLVLCFLLYNPSCSVLCPEFAFITLVVCICFCTIHLAPYFDQWLSRSPIVLFFFAYLSQKPAPSFQESLKAIGSISSKLSVYAACEDPDVRSPSAAGCMSCVSSILNKRDRIDPHKVVYFTLHVQFLLSHPLRHSTPKSCPHSGRSSSHT